MSIEKGHILPWALAQLDSLSVTPCQETAIPLYSPPLWLTWLMRRSHMTSSTPPSPCHLSWTTNFHCAVKCLDYKTDLSVKLSGELTRKALGRQLDVALCHDWHGFLLHAALQMTLVAVQSQVLTKCHQKPHTERVIHRYSVDINLKKNCWIKEIWADLLFFFCWFFRLSRFIGQSMLKITTWHFLFYLSTLLGCDIFLCVWLGWQVETQRKPFCEDILTALVDRKVKMIYGFTKRTATVGQNMVSKYNPPLFSPLKEMFLLAVCLSHLLPC